MVIQPVFIGQLRAHLFVPFDCKWNGLVRDVTAEFEHEGELVDPYEVFKRLVQIVRDNGQLDHHFPARSRLGEFFDAATRPLAAGASSDNDGRKR